MVFACGTRTLLFLLRAPRSLLGFCSFLQFSAGELLCTIWSSWFLLCLFLSAGGLWRFCWCCVGWWSRLRTWLCRGRVRSWSAFLILPGCHSSSSVGYWDGKLLAAAVTGRSPRVFFYCEDGYGGGCGDVRILCWRRKLSHGGHSLSYQTQQPQPRQAGQGRL